MRLLPLLALLAACGSVAAEGWVVCYFSSWAVYRPELGMFDVETLDPFLCTHAIFGFAGLSNQTWAIEVLDPWNENCDGDDPPGDHCAYQRFVALKEQNPALKTILAVGGWNEGSEDYSNMVADPAKRKTFVDSSLALVQKEGFDGLDIDWEYPTQRGGVEADRENFILLLDEFRAVFDVHGLLMTAALASGKPTIDPSYDVEGLIRNLDVFSIMTYDFHGAWENFTHHNAPLCGYPSDEGDFVYFNVVYSIDYWLSLGVPAEKLVLGVPLYGRCFTLDNSANHGMLADTFEPGPPGPYTRLPGTQGFNEICERLKDTQDCTSVLDPNLHEPYMYCKSDDLWCGYDDEDSVYLKARFAKNRNLAGVMVWTVDTDDFVPTCGTTKFALVNTMKEAFAKPATPEAPDCPRRTSTTSTQAFTTSVSPVTTTGSITSPDPVTTTDPTTVVTASSTTEQVITSTLSTVASTTSSHTTTVGGSITTEIPTYNRKPNCTDDPDTVFYPHTDCNKIRRMAIHMQLRHRPRADVVHPRPKELPKTVNSTHGFRPRTNPRSARVVRQMAAKRQGTPARRLLRQRRKQPMTSLRTSPLPVRRHSYPPRARCNTTAQPLILWTDPPCPFQGMGARPRGRCGGVPPGCICDTSKAIPTTQIGPYHTRIPDTFIYHCLKHLRTMFITYHINVHRQLFHPKVPTGLTAHEFREVLYHEFERSGLVPYNREFMNVFHNCVLQPRLSPHTHQWA